jgi:hypothetical protein
MYSGRGLNNQCYPQGCWRCLHVDAGHTSDGRRPTGAQAAQRGSARGVSLDNLIDEMATATLPIATIDGITGGLKTVG